MPEGQPLRIIHCFRSPVGGIFRHVRDLAEQHSRQGHDVGIVCDSTTGGEHEDRLFQQVLPYLSLGLTRLPIGRAVGLSDLPATYRTYNQIKSLRPDVLHGHGAKGGAMARIIGSALRAKKYRVARIYSPHGGSLHYDPARLAGKAVFAVERALARMGDAIVFVCDFEKQTYEYKVGVPRCTARTVYNGVNDCEFVPVPTRSDDVHFIYVGMLRDLKGPDVFIDAFAETERLVGRPLTGLMIGDGADRDRYAAMLTQRGLGRRLGLLPAMPVREAFSRSSIVVVPSRNEAMPYIVIEALAAGKTVIASRVGGIPEILGADSDALVPPGNASALAGTMAKPLTVPDWSADTMPPPDAFRHKFSATVMAQGILDLYRQQLAAIK